MPIKKDDELALLAARELGFLVLARSQTALKRSKVEGANRGDEPVSISDSTPRPIQSV